MFDGDGLLARVVVFYCELGEVIQHFMIHAVDSALVDGYAGERRNDALGDGPDRDLRLGLRRIIVSLSHDIAMAYDNNALDRDLLRLDLFEHLRQHVGVDPLFFRRRILPGFRGPIGMGVDARVN